MKFTQPRIPDVVIIEPRVFADERGWFLESFNEQKFKEGLQALGLPVPSRFVQDNHSSSRKGVLRGLHYQLPPSPQGKLVRVSQGAAFDVAVDIRKGSPAFGEWVGVEITAANYKMLWIPEGFAHGFLSMEEDTHFHYKTTDYYAPECEASILWNDTDLAIQWPKSEELLINPKDLEAPRLHQIVGVVS